MIEPVDRGGKDRKSTANVGRLYRMGRGKGCAIAVTGGGENYSHLSHVRPGEEKEGTESS